MNFVIIGSLALALMSCGRPDTTTVGQVQDCDNGTYFSLKTQTCQGLWGYRTEVDAEGFERIHIYNGVTVPRKINGRSPFLVTVAYNVSRPTTLEVVLKRVDLGQVGGDGLTNWQKLELDPGSGTRDLVLTPNYALPKGPAAAYIDGRWAIDTGYMLEIKGGDRFEDEDADQLGSWRVAGIQVDPDAPEDPSGKPVIIGPLEAPDEIVGCQQVNVSLDVKRIEFAASFAVALKMPGSGWLSYGNQTIKVDKGFSGKLDFAFAAKDEKNDKECAPPGLGATSNPPWDSPPGTYLFQLDIYPEDSKNADKDGKLDLQSAKYTVPEGSQPVVVASAS